jgi:hypothetical protein
MSVPREDTDNRKAKFNSTDLERRPEFTDAGAPGPARPTAIPSHMISNPRPAAPPPVQRNETPPVTGPGSPLTSIQDIDMEENYDLDEYGIDPEFFSDCDKSMQGGPAM